VFLSADAELVEKPFTMDGLPPMLDGERVGAWSPGQACATGIDFTPERDARLELRVRAGVSPDHDDFPQTTGDVFVVPSDGSEFSMPVRRLIPATSDTTLWSFTTFLNSSGPPDDRRGERSEDFSTNLTIVGVEILKGEIRTGDDVVDENGRPTGQRFVPAASSPEVTPRFVFACTMKQHETGNCQMGRSNTLARCDAEGATFIDFTRCRQDGQDVARLLATPAFLSTSNTIDDTLRWLAEFDQEPQLEPGQTLGIRFWLRAP
jgi:hypothetical protein